MSAKQCGRCYEQPQISQLQDALQDKYSAVRDTHFRRLSDLFLDLSSKKKEKKLYILPGEEENTVGMIIQYVTACHRLSGA